MDRELDLRAEPSHLRLRFFEWPRVRFLKLKQILYVYFSYMTYDCPSLRPAQDIDQLSMKIYPNSPS